jgi:hypothetical protein
MAAMNQATNRTPVPSRGRVFWWFALVVSLPILIPAAFVLLLVLHHEIMHYVPRASATMTVPDLAASVKAIAYQDGSRYLDIRASERRYLRQLPRPRNIFDLGSTSWFETCIYRTARNEIAFNMWRYVEIIADAAYRPDDGVRSLDGATWLGAFVPAAHGDIVFRPAEPARPAGPFGDRNRTAC